MGAQDILTEIVSLDEKITELKNKFEAQPEEEKAAVLDAHFDKLLKRDLATDEDTLALARCLDMIGSLADDHSVNILAKGMRSDNPEIREFTGDVLRVMAQDNVANLMPLVELAIEEGGILAELLPFVIAETDDPEAAQLIERFLSHDDAQVVVSAIEALFDIGDENIPESIDPLKGDTRKVTFEEEGKPLTEATLGEVVEDALNAFKMEE